MGLGEETRCDACARNRCAGDRFRTTTVMNLDLDGKRALVTGSSSGIGAGIAKALAAEGVAVVVHGRNAERASSVAEEIRQSGGQAAMAVCDLAAEGGAADVAQTAPAAFGGIDILVNNAGGASESEVQSWFALPVSEWAVTYKRNVLSAGYLIHALAPAMKENGWGRIIQRRWSCTPSGGSVAQLFGRSPNAQACHPDWCSITTRPRSGSWPKWRPGYWNS